MPGDHFGTRQSAVGYMTANTLSSSLSGVKKTGVRIDGTRKGIGFNRIDELGQECEPTLPLADHVLKRLFRLIVRDVFEDLNKTELHRSVVFSAALAAIINELDERTSQAIAVRRMYPFHGNIIFAT